MAAVYLYRHENKNVRRKIYYFSLPPIVYFLFSIVAASIFMLLNMCYHEVQYM